jgi:hypothetical protein
MWELVINATQAISAAVEQVVYEITTLGGVYMKEFFKFSLLMIIDFIFSVTGAYFLFKKLFADVGTGTGALGEALLNWIIAIVSFLIMLFGIGMFLYWLMFILEINIWYFVIAVLVGFVSFVIYLFRYRILDYFQK